MQCFSTKRLASVEENKGRKTKNATLLSAQTSVNLHFILYYSAMTSSGTGLPQTSLSITLVRRGEGKKNRKEKERKLTQCTCCYVSIIISGSDRGIFRPCVLESVHCAVN